MPPPLPPAPPSSLSSIIIFVFVDIYTTATFTPSSVRTTFTQMLEVNLAATALTDHPSGYYVVAQIVSVIDYVIAVNTTTAGRRSLAAASISGVLVGVNVTVATDDYYPGTSFYARLQPGASWTADPTLCSSAGLACAGFRIAPPPPPPPSPVVVISPPPDTLPIAVGVGVGGGGFLLILVLLGVWWWRKRRLFTGHKGGLPDTHALAVSVAPEMSPGPSPGPEPRSPALQSPSGGSRADSLFQLAGQYGTPLSPPSISAHSAQDSLAARQQRFAQGAWNSTTPQQPPWMMEAPPTAESTMRAGQGISWSAARPGAASSPSQYY